MKSKTEKTCTKAKPSSGSDCQSGRGRAVKASTKAAGSTRAKQPCSSGRQNGRGRAVKVWHISRFQQRYELPDDVRFDRKSPLLYVKSFCGSGSDDESCAYYRQLMSLRTKSNWLMIRGAFAELVNISANASKVFRGYLLDSNYMPAFDEQIGSWLGLQKDDAEKMLIELEQAGLIEKIDMPDFEQIIATKRENVTGRKKAVKKNPVASRETTRKNETARAPLNKKTKVKTKAKAKVKINGNEKVKEKYKSNRQRESGPNSNSLKGQAESQINQSPPATLPMPPAPPLSDPGESKVIPYPKAPPESLRNNNEPQKLSDVIAGMQHRYSVDAKAFGADIFQALGLTCMPDSEQGRRELGCFASLWQDALQTGLNPPALDELRSRAVAEAGRIRKHWHGRKGKPAAVFCKVFNGMITNAKTYETEKNKGEGG